MLKACLTCGRLADGSHCPDHARGGSSRQWRKLRANVLNRDGYRCQLCGAAATDVDHVIAVSDGGTDTLGNLRAACTHCNRA